MKILIRIIGLVCLPTIMFGQIGSSDIGHSEVAVILHFKDTTAANQILLPSKKSEDCCYHIMNVDDPASCQDVTIQLDANGNGFTTVDAVSTIPNNNDIVSQMLSQTNFDCSDIGSNTVTLTITNTNGNVSTCTSTVTVEDNIAPVAGCQDITIQLDNDGQVSVTAAEVELGSSDNCSLIIPVSAMPNIFNCSHIGTNSVTLTVNDGNGNAATCTAMVTVEDNIAPIVDCQDITLQLDNNGQASITAAEVASGSTDNCVEVNLINVMPNAFDCSHIGTNSVTLTVNDGNGNAATCTAMVIVEDNIMPTALCNDVTIILDANGNGVTTATAIDNGSTDNCGVSALNLSQETFNCNDVGMLNIVSTVTDVNGNSSTCNSTVTVLDNGMADLVCNDATIMLDINGEATILLSDVASTISDACGIASAVLSKEYFDCSDVGTQSVDLTVTDNNGNVSNCTPSITIQDHIAPTANCMNATVQLDANGNATITTADINDGSSDNCPSGSLLGGVASLSLDEDTFDCNDVNITNTVTLTVTDVNGNSSTCNATVIVQDDTAPTAVCKDVSVQLDASGSGSATAYAIGSASTDNCISGPLPGGVASLSLDNNTFNCDNLGNINIVTLMVTDINNNVSTCTANVTVEDNNMPTAQCKTSVSLELTSDGTTILLPSVIDDGSFNTCGDYTLSLSQNEFDCEDLNDAITVTLTIEDDDNYLQSSCQTTVNVLDPNSYCCLPPTTVCNDLTVQLDGDGMGSTTASAVGAGSFADCGLLSETITQEGFTCAEIGVVTVTYTMTDVNNEAASCTASITVEDNLAPVAACKNNTVEIQPYGTYVLLESDVYDDINSSDNCGITQVNFPATIYTCGDIGLSFPVLVTIMDATGNTTDCTAIIQVEKGEVLPDGWSINDIGIVTIGNEYTFDPCIDANPENNEFTITGSGNNATSSTTDNVAFASQSLCGDGAIMAKIESVTPNGYGGLMIRENTDAGAKQVSIFSNLTNVLRHEVRYNTNGAKQVNSFFKPSPFWLRLERQGDWIFAYYSTIGFPNTFQYVHSVFLPMQECIAIGLASFTYLPGSQTEVVFSNVLVSGSNSGFSEGAMPLEIKPSKSSSTALNLNLYPNPNTGQFNIQMNARIEEAVDLYIYNNYGQQVFHQLMEKGIIDMQLNLEQLPSGTYWLKMNGATQVLATKVFAITK